MNNPARPTAKIATPRFRAAKATDKGLEKKCLSFFPRNPLKSLDSDERIQGNPIGIPKGFRGETAKRQGNPKRSTGTRPRSVSPPLRDVDMVQSLGDVR